MAAQSNQRDGDGIIAAQHRKTGWDLMRYLRHLADVAGSFLDPGDVIDFRKPLQRGRLDIHSGAALHAIYNDGQLHRRCDGFVMLVQPFLRRLVVLGGDGENAIGAHRLDLGSEVNHFSGVVTARARQHRHTTLGFFERDFDHA